MLHALTLLARSYALLMGIIFVKKYGNMCCTSGRFKMKALSFWCEEKERKGECEENIKGTCTGRERKRRGRREGEGERERDGEGEEKEKGEGTHFSAADCSSSSTLTFLGSTVPALNPSGPNSV